MTRRERSWVCPEFALRLRKQIRRGGPVILVMLLLCWMAGVRARGTVDAPALVVLAFSAGVGWALWGIVCLKEAVWLGAAAHDMTWGAYRRSLSRTEPDPGDESSAFLVGQMMRVEQRVSEFAAETGMAAVTFALAGGRIGSWEDASSVGAGDRGHVALGYGWLEPDRSAALPYILEHELAHLRRQDGWKRLVAGTVTVTAAALCAGQLPLADAALALSGIAVAWAGYQWWGELACDRAANNRCGRETAVACWRQELDRRRAVPPLRRWGFSLLGLISHPPTRLRLWVSCWTAAPARDRVPRP
ncbi:hypothetical protein OG215_41450 (plasmid) [Streptomyces globisporus]|uniref:hypothetical protein n=1 Tax=Streptomyces globisporus TaxID=1908 RepID=UPI0038659E6F|nr:hypothetical protein OG215_41450 [Streptomyces globisporus]